MNLTSISSQKYFTSAALFLILIFTAARSSFTGNMGFFSSLLFWTVQVGGLLPLLLLAQLALQSSPGVKRWNVWSLTALSGVLAALLFAPVALFWDYVFAFADWRAVYSVNDLFTRVLEEATALILPVCISWLGVNAPRILQLNFQPTACAEQPLAQTAAVTVPSKPRSALFGLLPAQIGNDIVYLASELHYLRVVTAQGEALILYSLQNAMQELAASCDGVQTHRSYWVNKAHVEQIVGKAPSRQILTRQGHLVPISRRQLAAVRASLAT